MESTMKSILLSVKGGTPMSEVIDFPTGSGSNLDFYYKQIGCDCIDIVHTYALEELGVRGSVGEFCMVIDDEGLLKDNPVLNPIASLLYGCDLHGQPIAGNVLICQNRETPVGIETVGLTDYDVYQFHTYLGEIIKKHNERVKERQKNS